MNTTTAVSEYEMRFVSGRVYRCLVRYWMRTQEMTLDMMMKSHQYDDSLLLKAFEIGRRNER